MTKYLVWTLIGLLIFAGPASARSVDATEAMRLELSKLERGVYLEVSLQNGATVQGHFDRSETHSFFIIDRGTNVSTQIPYSKVKRINAMSKAGEIAIWGGICVAVAILLWLADNISH